MKARVAARAWQVLLIGSLLPFCWLGMQAVHELGHVLGLWMSGGTTIRVVLHPFTISRTDAGHNPHALTVVWAGPLFGAVLPLIAFGIALLLRFRCAYLMKFFAGFCLIANGCYLGVGSFDGVGDAGDLLRLGASTWQLWLFGGATVPAGISLWHGLGPHFQHERVRPGEAVVVFGLLAVIVLAEATLSVQ